MAEPAFAGKPAGAADHCRTRFYETPHEFNIEMQAEAWAWLKRFV